MYGIKLTVIYINNILGIVVAFEVIPSTCSCLLSNLDEHVNTSNKLIEHNE